MKPIKHDFNAFDIISDSSLYGTPRNYSVNRPRCSKIMIYLVVMGQNSDKRLIFFSLSLKAKLTSFLRVIAIIRIVIGAEIADLIFK